MYRLLLQSETRAASAQSFALWQQATQREHASQSLLLLLVCVTHVYCCSSCTSRSWWITHSTQRRWRGCNNIHSFFQRTAPIARSLCESCTWHDLLHPVHSTTLLTCLTLQTCSQPVNLINSVLWSGEGVTQARGCLRHEAGREFERWHCTIYCPRFLRRM